MTPSRPPSDRHVPVLLAEAIAALSPRADGRYLDATFGAGGYSRALLATEGARVLALDRDPAAVRGGAALVAAARGRLKLVEGALFTARSDRRAARHFAARRRRFRHRRLVDAARRAERGFSFRDDGPLDMRMGGEGATAAELVNTADEATLADILYYFGEERAARRIARAIVADREAAPFTTTGSSRASSRASRPPSARATFTPRRKAFQALRIAVNDELGELVEGLSPRSGCSRPGGGLAVVTFHSLEDRLVKLFLAARSGRGETRSRRLPGEPAPQPPTFRLEGRQPIAPLPAEVDANPRARSAKLRVAIRTAAPARGFDEALARRARLPALASGRG